MVIRLFLKLERFWAKTSSGRFTRYLRRKGISVGEGVCWNPQTCLIDLTRPSLISIGNNCFFNSNFTLLTHDWVSNVFLNAKMGFVNSSGKVVIGDNVSFGRNVMVLKNVTIGNNCFIGAGSIVTTNIPPNSIAVGAPCRVVMSIDDYFKKRVKKSEEEAFEYARSIKERFNREPVASDFWEEFVWFVDGNKIDDYPEIPIKKQLGSFYTDYKKYHHAKYNGFVDFLHEALKQK